VEPTNSLSIGGAKTPRHRLWLACFSLIVTCAGFSAIHGQVADLYHDDGIYAAVAKSLAEGGGYRIAGLPTNSAQTEYPFLYSPSFGNWIRNFRKIIPANSVQRRLSGFIFTISFVLLHPERFKR
jgi:hypothetical protein